MAGLAIDGLISNLNTSEIITALVGNVRAPAQRLTAQRNTTTNKLTALQTLNANVLGVRVAAENLGRTDTFRSFTTTSSNTSIVTATASSTASPGSYTISVQQLAAATQISSDPNNTFNSATTALGIEGTILVNNRAVSIRSTDTLRDVASRITNARSGISASVVEVESGKFRLSVRSLQTGASTFQLADASSSNILESLRLAQNSTQDVIANSITNGAASREFNVKVLPVGGLLGLSSDVPSGTITIANNTSSLNVSIDLSTMSLETIAEEINTAATAAGSSISATVAEVRQGVFRLEINSGDGSTPVFTDSNNVLDALGVLKSTFTNVNQPGQDAQFQINGIDVVRSSNTVSDVIEGVTLNLLNDDNPAQTSTVTVTATSESASSAIQAFVTAFNTTRSFFSTFASYNADTKRAGILLGDSAVLGVESSLSGLISRPISTLPSLRVTNLNNGAGIAPGSITITDRAGGTATIDLSSASTVQDVLDALNHNASIKVEASINRSGTGITIQDTSGGNGTLRIAESGSTTAASLGILGSSITGRIEGASIATPQFINLAQMGVTSNVDGTLSFNSSTFQSFAEANPDAVQAFFTQKNTGFSALATRTVDTLTDTRNGILTIRATSLENTIESYNKSIASIEERAKLTETRLRRQFTALEQSLSKMQEQSSYLMSQLSQTSMFNNR